MNDYWTWDFNPHDAGFQKWFKDNHEIPFSFLNNEEQHDIWRKYCVFREDFETDAVKLLKNYPLILRDVLKQVLMYPEKWIYHVFTINGIKFNKPQLLSNDECIIGA